MSPLEERSAPVLTLIRRLFRAVGLIDATPLSVRNSGRRLPRARAALLRYRLATVQTGGRI